MRLNPPPPVPGNPALEFWLRALVNALEQMNQLYFLKTEFIATSAGVADAGEAGEDKLRRESGRNPYTIRGVMPEDEVTEELQELEELEIDTPPEPAKEPDVVEIFDVDNPAWMARDKDLHLMIRELVDEEICSPSITFDSLLNYFSVMVDSIYNAKQQGTPVEAIKVKFLVGFVNRKLKGFTLFYMLQNRLPHIQSMDIAYMFSKDPRISHLFADAIRKSRKRWGCKHVCFLAANKRLARIAMKGFKKTRMMGKYYVAEDLKSAYIKL